MGPSGREIALYEPLTRPQRHSACTGAAHWREPISDAIVRAGNRVPEGKTAIAASPMVTVVHGPAVWELPR